MARSRNSSRLTCASAARIPPEVELDTLHRRRDIGSHAWGIRIRFLVLVTVHSRQPVKVDVYTHPAYADFASSPCRFIPTISPVSSCP